MTEIQTLDASDLRKRITILKAKKRFLMGCIEAAPTSIDLIYCESLYLDCEDELMELENKIKGLMQP